MWKFHTSFANTYTTKYMALVSYLHCTRIVDRGLESIRRENRALEKPQRNDNNVKYTDKQTTRSEYSTRRIWQPRRTL